MMKTLKIVLALAMCLFVFCGCGNATQVPELTLSAEDQELLSAIGDDIQVVEPKDFAAAAQALDQTKVGMIYQLTGFYRSIEEGESYPALFETAEGDAAVGVRLRYLNTPLTDGGYYTVTGIVAEESHGEHSHIVFDVLTVESYVNP